MVDNYKRYGIDSIRKGIIHFFFGKVLSAVAGIVTLLIVVRFLPVDEFAAYSVLIGLIVIFTALSGVGLTHVIARFVPELYSQYKDTALTQLIVFSLATRALILTALLITARMMLTPISDSLGLLAWREVFELFFIVIFLRVLSSFVFQVLESLLHQRSAQLGFLAATLVKLILILLASCNIRLSIQVLVWVDVLSEMAGLLFLGWSLKTALSRDNRNTNGEIAWIRDNLYRMVRFGSLAYGQHMSVLLYGSAPNRLLAGHLFALPQLAAFGFAQSFSDMIFRYLPAQLFQGLIRPVFVARYSERADFPELVLVSNIILKINFLILGLLLSILIVAGTPAIETLTNGKYGVLANLLLIFMIIVMFPESVRLIQDILICAVERNEILLVGNLLLSGSLILAIPLVFYLDSFAIVAANLVGLLLGNKLINWWLRKQTFDFRLDWIGYIRILIIIIAAVVSGVITNHLLDSWLISTVLCILTYFISALILNVLNQSDLNMLLKIKKNNPA